MSVKLEYLRMNPGSEAVTIGLVISINGHSGGFTVEGKLLPVDGPQTEPATEPVEPMQKAKPSNVDSAQRPKRKYIMKERKLKAPARKAESPGVFLIPENATLGDTESIIGNWPVSWANAICEALKGGNLTSSELMQHACRIRKTAIPTEKNALAKFRSAFSVSLNDVRKAGRAKRITENGLDKWSLS